MKIILMACTKDFLFRANGPFWARKWHILITPDRLKEFLKILHNEKGQ